MTSPIEADLAKAVASEFYKADYAAQFLGIEVLDVAQGYAKLSMEVQEAMITGVGICHGGMTFTLADAAFAYACNSKNRKTVALSCNITFLKPVNLGDTLTAIAEEIQRGKRTGTYDVSIYNQHDDLVALFRGVGHDTQKPTFEHLS